MPSQLDELKSRMINLSRKKALSSEDLEFLVQSLECKWFGIQVLAGKVLSIFTPAEAKLSLISWMKRHADDYQMLPMAQKALVSFISEEDVSWILPLFFAKPKSYRDFLITALVLYPSQSAIKQLIDDYHENHNFDSVIVLAACVNEGREFLSQKLIAEDDPKETRILRALSWGTLSKDQLLKFRKLL